MFSVIPLEELTVLKDIFTRLAKLLTSLRKTEEAVLNYKEALTLFPDDPKVLIDLAKLHMQVNYKFNWKYTMICIFFF